MTFRRTPTLLKPDAGLTLVELLISIGLGLIVMSLLGSMLTGIYAAQQRIFGASDIISESQIATEVFRKAVRSSTGLQIQSLEGGGQLLVVARLTEDATPSFGNPAGECVAMLWLEGSPDKLYLAYGDTGADLPSPTSTEGWLQVVRGMGPIEPSTSVFTLVDGGVTMAFITDPDTGIGSKFETRVQAPQIEEANGGCY